jgi:hypothetical protein
MDRAQSAVFPPAEVMKTMDLEQLGTLETINPAPSRHGPRRCLLKSSLTLTGKKPVKGLQLF